MESRENIKSEEDERSDEVFSMLERVYCRKQYMEKRERFGKCKKLVKEFERRMEVKIRKQEMLDRVEEGDFRREELLGKYTAKKLYKQDNGKFKEEYLKKLKRNWTR